LVVAEAEGGALETVEADFVDEGEVSEVVAVLATEVAADFEVAAEGLVVEAVADSEAGETILGEEDSEGVEAVLVSAVVVDLIINLMGTLRQVGQMDLAGLAVHQVEVMVAHQVAALEVVISEKVLAGMMTERQNDRDTRSWVPIPCDCVNGSVYPWVCKCRGLFIVFCLVIGLA